MKSRSPLNFIRRLRIYQWVWGRSWRRAFSLREHFKVNEEAFHLGLAALVGIIAGVVNVGFLYGVEGVKILALRHPGDLVGIAELFSLVAAADHSGAGRIGGGPDPALGRATGTAG